ncbi:MAG: hypothetical protein DMF56_18955 [Acidobacteria bacterium]|nr:MAG: hypothetical protein DMF56_18955 [Acidobacteriota bacterium]
MSLLQRLNVSTEEQRSIGSTVGRIHSINEFFADAVDGLKSADFVSAIGKSSPWLSALGSTIADVVPVVKFAVMLFERLTSIDDPARLGLLAFTLAYEQSLVQAAEAVGAPRHAMAKPEVLSAKLRSMGDVMPEEALDFTRVTFADALAHPFVKYADELLNECTAGVGYNAAERLKLQNEVHQRFVVHLKTLLSHRDTREKFAPFRTYMEAGTGERTSIAALMEHAAYQRALYQEYPVFGKEAFALSHI